MADPVRRLDPPRKVLVRHDDGRWYTGFQTHWVQQPEGGWRAHVEYSVAPGSKHLRSVDTDQFDVAE